MTGGERVNKNSRTQVVMSVGNTIIDLKVWRVQRNLNLI